jgi:hypothetical protein
MILHGANLPLIHIVLLIFCCNFIYNFCVNGISCSYQETEEGGRGRFKSHTNAPARISDREKKAALKT